MGVRLAAVVARDGPRRDTVLCCHAQCPRRVGPGFVCVLVRQRPWRRLWCSQRVLWRLWVNPRRLRRGSPRCRPPSLGCPRGQHHRRAFPRIDYPGMRRHRRPPDRGSHTSTRRCNARDARPANSSTSESEVWLLKPSTPCGTRVVGFSREWPARSAPPCRGRPSPLLPAAQESATWRPLWRPCRTLSPKVLRNPGQARGSMRPRLRPARV
jgi:hypothetical protein